MSHGISPASRSRSAAAVPSASSSSAAAAKAKLNGTGLSAGALLAASAQASTELARMLSKHDRSRSRSRSRTRSPANRNPAAGLLAGLGSTSSGAGAGAAAEEDPFLVHTAGSAATSIHSHSHHSHSHSRHRSKSPHAASASAARRSSKHRSAATTGSSSNHHHRSSRDRDRERERDRDVPASSAASSVSLPSVDRDRDRDRTRVSRSSKHREHRSKSRDRHRSRTRSRSASRPRLHSGLIEPSVRVVDIDSSAPHQQRHGSSSHHSRRHGSSASGFQATLQHRSSRSRSRTRSRSHSRNRYPDGLAPHMQTTQGSPDHELRSRYGNGGVGSASSPPMSPSRLDARFQFEQARRDREDAELRLIMAEQQRRRELEHARQREMHETGIDPYGADGIEGTGDSPRYRAQRNGYDREYDREYDEDARRFDLEEDVDDPKRETRLPGAYAGQRGGVLTCPLCECRFEEPAKGAAMAGSGSKVPRYLLCGHTYCTGCLSQLVQAQEELSAVVASEAPITSLSLPCPHVGSGGSACGPTPVSLEHGAMSLPVNRSYLDVSAFLRSRRAAGLGLRDTGVGRGDERGEEEKVAELNAELSADAEHTLRSSMGAALPTALPCQQCQVHIAALYCQACNVRFCAACSASVHVGRALAEHVKRGLVVTINVARARGLLFQTSGVGGGTGGQPINPALMCPTHSDQQLSLYCRTCQVPVCRDCVTPLFHGRHLQPAHDVDLLSTVLASTLSELKGGVSSLEGVVHRLEGSISAAGQAVTQVSSRIADVRAELKDAFNLVRSATMKALADREKLLETELLRKGSEKESRIQSHRAQLAKVLVAAKAAQEEAVRILGSAGGAASSHSSSSAEADIFSIKALLDVRAAITACTLSSSPVAAGSSATAGGLDATTLAQQDVLLRLKPRDLIRHLESQISRQGGLIASVPSPPAFVGFAAQGTAMIVSWAPGSPAGEGEVLEYTLHVCELPREWRSKLRALNPSLFPNPPDPALPEDAEADSKWNGDGTLGSRSRQAVNWVSVAPGAVSLGGAGEMNWQLGGGTNGAEFAGPYTTLYSGEVTQIKHDNLNVLSAYIYRLTVKNDLGASTPVYSMPCTLPCMRLSYASDMDSNGLITFLGSAGGSAPWSNPALSGLIEVSASSIQIGEGAALVSRAASTLQTLNRHLSWVKLDLGRGQPFRLQISHYTLAHCGRGVGVRRALRNWALQGSLNGVDWVTLREHVNDQTLAPIPLATGTWSVSQPAPAAYRFIRILQTDVNHANDHHLALGQIELYGWLVRD